MDRVTARWWAVGALSNFLIAIGWVLLAVHQNKLYPAFLATVWVVISASNFAAWYTAKKLAHYRTMVDNARKEAERG